MPTRIIDRQEVRRLTDHGAQLAEVLPQAEYAFEHLPGAIHVPLKQLDNAALERLDTSRPVIAYCNDFL